MSLGLGLLLSCAIPSPDEGLPDLGHVAASTDSLPEGYSLRSFMSLILPLSDDINHIEHLLDCPRTKLGFLWDRGMLRMEVHRLQASEKFDAWSALFLEPDPAPGSVAFERIKQSAGGFYQSGETVQIHQFTLDNIKGLKVETENTPVKSKNGHWTSYYLFPENGEPGYWVLLRERRVELDRTPAGVHRLVALMRYPAIEMNFATRFGEANLAFRANRMEEAFYTYIHILCNSPDLYFRFVHTAIKYEKFQIARDMMSDIHTRGEWSPVGDDMMRKLMKREREKQEKNRGEPPF